MRWMVLYLAIALEVGGTTALKFSNGLTRLGPFAAALALYALSFVLLAMSLRELPVSVAYAVWSGLGTLIVAAIGMTMLGEPVTLARVALITLILVGAVGLNLTSGGTALE